jgi:mannose-6-phosphate isomerase-like protein (cupin superfamily)
MAPHPNVQRLARGLELRNRLTLSEADQLELDELFAEDVVWHGGGKVFSSDTEGRDRVFELFRLFAQQSGETLQETILQVFADETHGVALAQLHAKRDDREMDWREIHLFLLNRDGKISDFWGIPEDQDAVDEFWSDDRDEATRLEASRKALGLPALLPSSATGGALSVNEIPLPARALIAPPHTHHKHDEAVYVLEGELSFWIDGDVHRGGPGEFAFLPKGLPHTIFNAAEREGRFLEFCWPGGLDEYFEEMAVALSGTGPPDMALIKQIADKYEIEPDLSSVGEIIETYGVQQQRW